MGNVQMEAEQIRYKGSSYKNLQTAMDAALGGGGGSSTLAGLTDTDISTPTSGQVLTYDSTAEKWENSNIPAPSTPALSDLTDTGISTPTNGQVLTYDSTAEKWVNANAGGIGVVFSTTETKIGVYNGADLYSKLIPGVQLANNANVSVSCPGIIPRFLFAMEHADYTTDEDYTPIPYLGTNKMNIYYDAKNGNIVIELTGNYSTATADVIAIYTKPANNNSR